MNVATRHVDLAEHRDHDVDVLDMVDELVAPHQHREHYTTEPIGGTRWSRDHITRVPSLLDQLEHSMPSSLGEAAGARGFESRPAARLEALDALIRIDHDATAWVQKITPDAALPATTAAVVRRLGGLMPRLEKCYRHRPRRGADHRVDCCLWHKVEDDIRGWWAQARIMAGWDTPAWQPDGSCPACGTLGGLRIRLSASMGFCVACRERWGPDAIGLLGEHIRAEAFRRSAGRRVEPCWCPWPTPVDRMGPLCPRCGSARCHRAVSAAMVSV